MIRILFRALSGLSVKTKKAAPQLSPRVWFMSGKAARHTFKFITKQAPKGFKFPK
jgi:hypothetical protein